MMHLAEKEIPDSRPRMGRKPLGAEANDTKATQVRLEASVRARINAVLAPTESLAAFLRKGAEAELKRREKP